MNGQMQSKLDKLNIFNFNAHVAESWLYQSANCVRRSYPITHFLSTMLWVRTTFQLRSSLSALFRYLCVYVH